MIKSLQKLELHPNPHHPPHPTNQPTKKEGITHIPGMYLSAIAQARRMSETSSNPKPLRVFLVTLQKF